MSALVKIQKEADKEVFAVKLGETYVAVVNDDDNFYFLPDLPSFRLRCNRYFRFECGGNASHIN